METSMTKSSFKTLFSSMNIEKMFPFDFYSDENSTSINTYFFGVVKDEWTEKYRPYVFYDMLYSDDVKNDEIVVKIQYFEYRNDIFYRQKRHFNSSQE